jgi:hypothetical protein
MGLSTFKFPMALRCSSSLSSCCSLSSSSISGGWEPENEPGIWVGVFQLGCEGIILGSFSFHLAKTLLLEQCVSIFSIASESHNCISAASLNLPVSSQGQKASVFLNWSLVFVLSTMTLLLWYCFYSVRNHYPTIFV